MIQNFNERLETVDMYLLDVRILYKSLDSTPAKYWNVSRYCFFFSSSSKIEFS